MNLLLIHPDELKEKHKLVSLEGRRAQHLQNILKVSKGQCLKVGILNGKIGTAAVSTITSDRITLTIEDISQAPPPTLPLTLILALPRPRMLQRTLQTIATMGVEKLCLIQSSRVEKSFWQTPLLKEESINEQLILGLEQARATQMPSIEFHQRFRPFVEDELETIAAGKQGFIAHPGDYPYPARQRTTPSILAIGPEGGFIDKEVDTFKEKGFNPIQLGQRILRVETAVPVLLAKLYD